MKPFSPMYFIKENKTRCVLLIFMLFLGYAAYLGGLYVTNPMDNWEPQFDYIDQFVSIFCGSGNQGIDDFIKEAEDSGKVQVIRLGSDQGFLWETIMGFTNGYFSLTFCTVEDFKIYCEYMGIECDDSGLKSGSFITSEMLANNRKLKIGDKIDSHFYESIYGEFTLNAITKEDGYMQYYISDEEDKNYRVLFLPNDGVSVDEAYSLAYSLQEKYQLDINDDYREDIEKDFGTFNIIYIFIIILMSVILAITINAAFVGMYLRRNFEFSVYRAIGISKKRIIGKIVGELVCMDALALICGGAIFFFALYLFNNLVLYPVGKYFSYFHPMALFGLMVCNLSVLIPLIITRCRQMLKADITEY